MIQRMRRANGLAAEALRHAGEVAREGVTTAEVDAAVCEFLIARHAYPVGINYHGFPRGLCASPNEVVLHGVPNTRPLESGDICNFDVTCYLDGAYGDCSAMSSIGQVDEDAQRLVSTTKALLDHLVKNVGPGILLSGVGDMCRKFTRGTGFESVEEFCGHFIGRELHMSPNVFHVPNGTALPLRPGMTFTMEPILVEGSAKIRGPCEDGWTILSRNGGWSAQWEHTVLITENGCEVLTKPL